MKNIIKTYAITALFLSAFSCSEKDKVNDVMYNQSNNSGGILRTISINGTNVTTSVNSANLTFGLDAGKFDIVLEAMDNNNGGNLNKIETWVSYKNNRVIAPATTAPPETAQVLFKTFQASDLSRNSIGLPQLSFSTTVHSQLFYAESDDVHSFTPYKLLFSY